MFKFKKMKKITVVLFTFFICFNSYTQIKRTSELKPKSCVKKNKKEIPPPPPLPKDFIYIKPHKVNFTKYNLSKRLSFYPFNKATKIMVVSFSTKFSTKADFEVIRDSVFLDSLDLKKEKIESIEPFKIPMKNDSILFDKMDQIKSLLFPKK